MTMHTQRVCELLTQRFGQSVGGGCCGTNEWVPLGENSGSLRPRDFDFENSMREGGQVAADAGCPDVPQARASPLYICSRV